MGAGQADMKPYYETELGKLYHGDCLEIMPNLEPVDLVLTDPPYGKTDANWDKSIPLELIWLALEKLRNMNTPVLLFGDEPFSSFIRMSNIKEFKYDWIWIKNRPTGALSKDIMPLACIENISVFYSKPPTYNPQMKKRTEKELKRLAKNSTCNRNIKSTIGFATSNIQKRDNMQYKYPRRDIYIDTVLNRSIEKVKHPNQKPVALFEYLIKTYTHDSDTVLDFTMGSGTTAIACERLNRRWIGIEIEEKYCEIAAKRIEKERSQLKLFT